MRSSPTLRVEITLKKIFFKHKDLKNNVEELVWLEKRVHFLEDSDSVHCGSHCCPHFRACTPPLLHTVSESGTDRILSLGTLWSKFTRPVLECFSMLCVCPGFWIRHALPAVREVCSLPTQPNTSHVGTRQCLQRLL